MCSTDHIVRARVLDKIKGIGSQISNLATDTVDGVISSRKPLKKVGIRNNPRTWPNSPALPITDVLADSLRRPLPLFCLKVSTPMRFHTIAAVVAIGACSSALATSSVSFEAQGYLVDIVVGYDARPVVAGLSIATPGSFRRVEIPMQNLKIEAFDTAQKVLLLRFTNPGDAKLPKSFSLTVRNDAGALQWEGKSITGRFSWGM